MARTKKAHAGGEVPFFVVFFGGRPRDGAGVGGAGAAVVLGVVGGWRGVRRRRCSMRDAGHRANDCTLCRWLCWLVVWLCSCVVVLCVVWLCVVWLVVLCGVCCVLCRWLSRWLLCMVVHGCFVYWHCSCVFDLDILAHFATSRDQHLLFLTKLFFPDQKKQFLLLTDGPF